MQTILESLAPTRRLEAGSLALAIIAVLGVSAPQVTFAQSYPIKPVRLISPYAPGGGNDTLARTLTPKLSEYLGQPVIVESRPGANAIVGTELAARSAPDGYTIILIPSGHAVNASLYRKLPYDSIRDFAPVTLAGSGPLILVVHPSLPVKTVKELIALAHGRPGELTYSSAGIGSSGHLAGALFSTLGGVRTSHVPYKGNSAALIDLIAGQVTMNFATTLSVLPHVRSRRLHALAITSDMRSAATPELPTVSESGLPGYSAGLWYGFLAPANTPRDIVQRLNLEISKVIKTPEVRDRLASQGIDAQSNSPEEFARLIASDIEKWARVIKEAGVRVE